MMKRVALAVLISLFFSAGFLFAQDTELNLNAEQVDLSKVDLSTAEFFFQGPMDIYVDNVQYGNKEYAAILHYDGKKTITVKAPKEVTRENKPERVSVSDTAVSLTDGKIVISGLQMDGGTYEGTFVYESGKNAFTLVQAERTGTAAADLEQLRQENKNLKTAVNEQEKEINSLQEKLAQKEERIIDLDSELRSLRGEEVAGLRQLTDRMTATLAENPDKVTVQHGRWQMAEGRYSQSDASMLYAKRVIPVVQSGGEQLYSFKGASGDNGWRGFGLHFLASKVEPADKYGLGESYLVWITRDSEFYHTGKTYVQLYRSDRYFDMVQLASSAVDVDSNAMNDYHVYVNHSDSTITVFAAGRKVFTYEAKQMFSEGSHVALRTLGSAEFGELTIREAK